MNLHLVRWAFLRLPTLRRILILAFCIYAVLPNHIVGKSFVNYLAIGYVSGALALAVAAFVFLLITAVPLSLILWLMLLINKGFVFRDQWIPKYFGTLFYLCAISATVIIIFSTYTFHKDDWTVWFTTSVAIFEILQFIWRGSFHEKKTLYYLYLKLSIVMYGALAIFAGIIDISSLEGRERLILLVAIAHLLADTYIFRESINKPELVFVKNNDDRAK